MAFDFPAVADVRLMKPPLAEVICQVRFPAILRITQARPYKLQDLVTARFPEYGEDPGFHVNVNMSHQESSTEIEPTHNSFFFLTKDQTSRLIITADSFAVSTTNYNVWDQFAADLNLAYESMVTVYGIPYAKRIGLRYINKFSNASTGAESMGALMDLLRPELTSFFRGSAWSDAAEGFSQVTIRDDSRGALLLRVAYGYQTTDPSIFLDFDYFEEGRIELNDLISKCSSFHDEIYRAFRWSLNPQKLSVFELAEEATNS